MKLNEQELNYILSECLQNMLNEDFTPSQIKKANKNRVFNNNISVNSEVDYPWDEQSQQWSDNPQITNIKPYPNNKSKYNKKANGWKLAGKIGATVVGSMAIGALFGSSNIGNLLGTLSMFGGIAAALQMVGASHRRYDILNKMQIPRSADMAKQVASLAAAERISLQMECKNLQGNYKNAEKAYNKLAQANNINFVSWDELSKQIGNNFSITEKYLGGGGGEVNINTNFNNQNVTESKLYEANLNAQEFNQSIQGVDYFDNAFKYDDGSFDTKTGLETVAGIAALYKETYVLWYKWTRYIQVLIKYFPDDLKWDEIMRTAGKVKPENIWNTLYHKVFPKMSQVTDAIGGKNTDGRSREEIQQDIDKEYSDSFNQKYSNIETELVVTTTSYKNDKGIECICFKDKKDNLYAVVKQTFDDNGKRLSPNDRFLIKNLKKYVFREYQDDTYGYNISMLNANEFVKLF